MPWEPARKEFLPVFAAVLRCQTAMPGPPMNRALNLGKGAFSGTR
jgi:hypothetical protein